jgi:hypothetical protein
MSGSSAMSSLTTGLQKILLVMVSLQIGGFFAKNMYPGDFEINCFKLW